MIQPGMLLQNRYWVLKKLDSGGFGETFEVYDQGMPKVLKVLKIPAIIDNEYQKAVSLFQREAKVLIQMRHPGIPKVEPDGYFTFVPEAASEPLHCLAMEKIDGQNLEQWRETSANPILTQERAIEWLKQLVEILEKLHEQQYFHRDIKPANIMLKPDGQLVLIDFGGVREITDTYLGKIGGGREGTGLISFGYTPIEQIYGKAVPQSDFFALGRTFAHLLTAKHPLDLNEDPETGKLIWRDLAPQISASVADLLDYMMADFPGKRPQNNQVILQRLEALQLAPESPLPPLIVSVLNPTSAPSEPAKIDLPHPRKRLLPVNSIGFKVGFAGVLLGLMGLISALPQIAMDLNDRGLESYKAGKLKLAEFYYRVAIALKPNQVETHFNQGLLYDAQHDFNRARAQYEIAKQFDFDKAYSRLGRLAILEHKCDAAIPLLLQGLEIAQDNSVKAALHKNLGWALLCQNRDRDAESHLRNSIALDGDRAAPHCLLAQVLDRQGTAKEAHLARRNCLKYTLGKYSPEEEIWQSEARQRLDADGKMLLSRD